MIDCLYRNGGGREIEERESTYGIMGDPEKPKGEPMGAPIGGPWWPIMGPAGDIGLKGIGMAAIIGGRPPAGRCDA